MDTLQPKSNRLLVATRKGLFEFNQNNTDHWEIAQRSFLGDPVSMVLNDTNNQTLYAALNLGHFGCKLHRSLDDGKSWTEIQVPSYGKIKSDQELNLALIWCLAPGKDDCLWAGTIPGGLFRSDDNGETWQLIESLWNEPLREQWFGGGYDQPGIHSICVDPFDQNKISVAVSCGGVWLSEDNGNTWKISTQGMVAEYMPPDQAENSATQDPHRMVQCKTSPKHFWVQHHNGIFKSDDYCQNWQRIYAQPSSFGFAVAVHPSDPDTAWFAPAIKDEKRYPTDGRLVVTKTQDGGKTFSTLDAGLPDTESYDLIYRHCLEVDASGKRLAMASTTGGLWLSDDGGNSWQTLSNNLPPVYALQFT
ncbi:WD40/YVTN/BNR-like repeat-containing protein [Aurantivibrio infirmus]